VHPDSWHFRFEASCLRKICQTFSLQGLQSAYKTSATVLVRGASEWIQTTHTWQRRRSWQNVTKYSFVGRT